MPEFVGTFGEILERELRGVVQTTPVRLTVAGSKARAILEASARETSNLGELMDLNIQRAFLPTSTGRFLEYFGAMVGIVKYPQRNAEVTSEDRALKLYTRFGTTFGTINGGSGFTVSSGTILTAPSVTTFEDTRGLDDTTAPDTAADRSIHYITTANVYCAADQTEAFLPAKAATGGLSGNLAAPGMIRTHTFTSYADNAGKSLLVTNTKPVLNGSDIESESSFRYRISKQITAVERANQTAISLAALSVPGVADIVIIPFEDGAGRFNLYVKSISSTVSDRLLLAVQESIDRVIAIGNIGYARRPYEVGIEIDTNVVYHGDLKETDKVEIRAALKANTINYINSLDLGQPLILRELSSNLRQVDSRVTAVGSNRTTLFDAVFGFWPARMTESGKRREKLISESIVVPAHARIIVEPSLSDPIRFI